MPPVAVQLSYPARRCRRRGRRGAEVGVGAARARLRRAPRRRRARRRPRGPTTSGFPFLAIDPVDGSTPDPGALSWRPRSPAPTSWSSRTSARSRSTPTRRRSPPTVLAEHDGRGRVPPPRPAVATRRTRHAARHPAAPRRTRCTSPSTTTRGCSSRHRGFDGRHVAQRVRSRSRTRRPRRDARRSSASRPTTSCCCSPRARSRARTCPPRSSSPPSSRAASPSATLRLWITGPAEDGYDDVFARLARRRRPCPITVGRAASRRRRVRGRRPGPLPVDVGGLRQPGHRVDRPPAPDRRRPLPRARRAPRRSVCTCSRSTTSTASQAWLRAPDPAVLEAQRRARAAPLLPRRPPPRIDGGVRCGRMGRVVSADDPVVAAAGTHRPVGGARASGSATALLLLRDRRVRRGRDRRLPERRRHRSRSSRSSRACVVLPVPIVLGYGLRAAEREDREAAARRAGGEPPTARQ